METTAATTSCPTDTGTVPAHNILWKGTVYFGVTMKKGQHLAHSQEYIDAYEAHLASLPNKKVFGIPLDRKNMVYTTVVEGVDFTVSGDEVHAIPKLPVAVPRTFTESDIAQLQTKVHAITGDGEVMALFNELLGVAQTPSA